MERRAPGSPSDEHETIVLVHGLARTRRSMESLALAALGRGYDVVSYGYRSRAGSIADHAFDLDVRLEQLAMQGRHFHLVTHSMGGIIVRAALAREASLTWRGWIGRIVMLAPPNGGSEITDHLRAFPPYRWLLGTAATELGTRADDAPQQLGDIPADLTVGVITGTRSWSPLGALWLPRPHDGRVSVESARLPGIRDLLLVDRGHTFVMKAPEVHDAVFRFLERGSFARPDGHR